MWSDANRLTRDEALAHWTVNGAWFSREQGIKGALIAGQLADLAVLDRDYFACPENEIIDITSDITIVNGEIVHAKDKFNHYEPEPLKELPDWSPLQFYGAPGFTTT